MLLIKYLKEWWRSKKDIKVHKSIDKLYKDMNTGRRLQCSQFDEWKKQREYLAKLH